MPEFQTGHIGLNVTNLDRSIRFYQQLFGFDVLVKSDKEKQKFAFLGFAGNINLTLWQQSSKGFPAHEAGLHHLSFGVSSIDQLKRFEGRLKENNVSLIYPGIVAHAENNDVAALYFQDPDGIRLEVFSPEGGKAYSAPADGAPACGFF